MGPSEDVTEFLRQQPFPPCAQLMPFSIIRATGNGDVHMVFEPQPAFTNYYGITMGGFSVAMLDMVVSMAALAGTRLWLPTVEIKTSFLRPLEIAACTGAGRVVRAGRNLVFTEGRLLDGQGRVAAHATATQSVPGVPVEKA